MTTAPTAQNVGATSTGDEDSPPANLKYIIWDSPPEQKRSVLWGWHTGLYDGTGYGDDTGVSTTPGEPEDDVHDICETPPLSIKKKSARERISTRSSDGEDLYPDDAQNSSPLTADEKRNYETLKSIYHAYAYPLGERTPSTAS